MVHPSGPSSHCGTCLGLVQASKTIARGASKTRVISSCVSVGVVYVVTPSLVPLTMGLLLLLEVFEVVVEPRVARIPEAAKFSGPLGDLLERGRVEGTGAPLRFSAALNEPGTLEHAEVLGYGRPAHREGSRQLLDRGGTAGEAG